MTSSDPPDGWDGAPAALLRLGLDGKVLAANRTALDWLGRTAQDVVGVLRVTDLLTAGGRLYWETHLSPLLHAEGRVEEVALELEVGGVRRPVLLSAVVHGDVIEVAASSAAERVRFEAELRAARAAARASERRVRALQDVTAALSQAVGVEAVAQALLAAATGPLRAGQAELWLADETGALVPRGSAASGEAPREDAVRVRDDGRVVVPLEGQREQRGALVLVPSTGAGADPLDVEVCTAVGQQAGTALDRAWTYEQSASVAHQLQQSLLAVEPPADERFEVATVYRPGVEALEVGGDWYDVFLSGPGLLSVVVGDVVGRGLAAASAMGQLRSAVRAIAGPGVGPAQLLTRLDRFVEHVRTAAMATLAYAELDLVTGRVRYACAGHPPPLLVSRDGTAGTTASLLWSGRSTPLGAFFVPTARPEAELLLQPGDRLLLCTDGLFERRGRDLDEGLERLVDVAGHLVEGPLDGQVQALTTTLLDDEESRDDVCVLLLSWAGDRFSAELSADLAGLSAARSELHAWLGERVSDDEVRDDLVLAASEALANAAEHGGRSRPEERVCLEAWLQPLVAGPDEVVMSVRDGGRWRPARPGRDERGRGLKIIAALVDTVDVRWDEGTTVLLRRRVEVAS